MAASSADGIHSVASSNDDDSSAELEAAMIASVSLEQMRLALIRQHNMTEVAVPADGACLFTCFCLYIGLPIQDRMLVRAAIVTWMVRVETTFCIRLAVCFLVFNAKISS